MKAKTLIIAIAVIVVSSAAGLTGSNFMRRINNNVEVVIKIKFKQIVIFAGLCAFVFSLGIALQGAVYAGEGGGIPGWCTDDWDLYEYCSQEGQCCIRGDIKGVCEADPPNPFICNCVGLYDGPLLWDPCKCSYSCGSWPQ